MQRRGNAILPIKSTMASGYDPMSDRANLLSDILLIFLTVDFDYSILRIENYFSKSYYQNNDYLENSCDHFTSDG